MRRKIIKRGLNQTIGKNKGTYYGEWLKVPDCKAKPYGCGLLVNDKKVILGYVKNGNWDKSCRLLKINREEKNIKIYKKVRARPQATFTKVGIKFGENGMIKDETMIRDVTYYDEDLDKNGLKITSSWN